MTIPRRSQVSLSATPFYHCIARCVRRAFLCGDDHYSRRNFDHRRAWLVERLKYQAKVFGIDICAYAIMSNHYHVVVRIDRDRVLGWSDEEIIARWTTLFSGPLLVKAAQAGKKLTAVQRHTVAEIVGIWRQRLYDISWFMRCLNETISRRANAEDDCTGRFWEGRFKSQALLDEAALLSCMAYVDLNPVRAGIAESLEDSNFTSIQERLRQIAGDLEEADPLVESSLLPFWEGRSIGPDSGLLPHHLRDYIELVDCTGRVTRPGKRGFLAADSPRIIVRLGLSPENWLELALEIQSLSLQAIGALDRLDAYSQLSGRRWIQGRSRLARLYAD